MKNMLSVPLLACLVGFATTAQAADPYDDTTKTETTASDNDADKTANPETDSGNTGAETDWNASEKDDPNTTDWDPKSQSGGLNNPEADPPVPSAPPIPEPEDDVQTYAGVGSNTAYMDAGVVEAGGSLSFATGADHTAFSADPMIGFFFYDNLELSAILGTRYLNVEGTDATRVSIMLEPSLHVPFTDQVFGFVGFGGGMAFASAPSSADHAIDYGFSVAPRAGAQFLVGRSGLLNVGGRYALTFIDADIEADVDGGATVLAFTNAFDLQVGYTVMF